MVLCPVEIVSLICKKFSDVLYRKILGNQELRYEYILDKIQNAAHQFKGFINRRFFKNL